jgi:CCR4-NOT transcription complex subunit 4
VNKNKAYNQNSPHGPSYSAYVTFSKPSEASIAILSLDDKMIDNHLIRASFGTTKYCSYFLKGIECNNKECLFLHKWADENDIIKRGDLTSNKIIFTQQHNYAKKIADIYNPDVRKKIMSSKKGKTVFPSPDIIYRTITLMDKENIPKNKKNSVSKNENNSINKKNNSPLNNKSNKEKDENNGDENANHKKEDINSKNNVYSEEESDGDEQEGEEEDYENNEDKSMNELDVNNSKKKNVISPNNNVIGSKNQKINKKTKIFLNRDKSRFDFCKNNSEKENNIIVPKHILNLIKKKIYLYNLTKHMHQKIIDKLFLNESIKDDNKAKNDEWIKFINDNIDMSNYNNYNNNDEFINDIDKINHFIFNKVTSQNCSNNK